MLKLTWFRTPAHRKPDFPWDSVLSLKTCHARTLICNFYLKNATKEYLLKYIAY